MLSPAIMRGCSLGRAVLIVIRPAVGARPVSTVHMGSRCITVGRVIFAAAATSPRSGSGLAIPVTTNSKLPPSIVKKGLVTSLIACAVIKMDRAEMAVEMAAVTVVATVAVAATVAATAMMTRLSVCIGRSEGCVGLPSPVWMFC